jgi:hypothetical protein
MQYAQSADLTRHRFFSADIKRRSALQQISAKHLPVSTFFPGKAFRHECFFYPLNTIYFMRNIH